MKGTLAALEAAMLTGVTFGTLPVGAVFHFPARPETLYVKVTARRFALEREPPSRVNRFTTGARTAVVEVKS